MRLHPTSKGARLKFSGDTRTVVRGPFVGPKDLVAGFWMFKVNSLDEAIELVQRCFNPMEGESEIRPVFEAEDFRAEYTSELREPEARMRAEMDKRR